MDAGRYGKHYAKMLSKAAEGAEPSAKDRDYVKLLWVRLIDAYIAPNGSREVNLPSFVRDPILNAPTEPMPPASETLDLAVKKTYELMEESVLVPFLNSCSDAEVVAHNERQTLSAPNEEHSSMFSRMKKSREASPPHSADGHTSGGHRMIPPKARFGGKHSGAALSTSMSNTSDANWSGPGMTDDSGSTGSPTNESPMTPPMSSASSDPYSSLSSSPKHSRDTGMWKKLGRLSGMGKKKGSGFYDN
ncbi:hypothetical protein AMS68_002576 [Peltaster fructicola]|uniref:RGS domain-containing protein n=1 Tax=Peltaster fructicola TaxID=286661 RepID=A0A6H0XR08_9PEZI|nr:hypothetical protein AMS68_002576 [Peltaster fructicola]